MNAEQKLKEFDIIFNTNTLNTTKFEDMKILKKLFCLFKEKLYTPNLEYKKILHKYNKLADELLTTLSKEQKELFIKATELKNEMSDEEDEQLFLFGFIMAKEMDIETKLSRD